MITTDYNILQFASFITNFYNFSLKTTWPIVIIFYVKQKKFITPVPQGWNNKFLVKIDAILKILFLYFWAFNKQTHAWLIWAMGPLPKLWNSHLPYGGSSGF